MEEDIVPPEPTPEEVLSRSDLTLLVGLRDQLQKLRIAGDIEKAITQSLIPEVQAHPAWPWLEGIRGVSYTSAALVLGHIDIAKCDTVSSLWRYAGYGVVDGKRERPTKGVKLPYNARLKTMVWRLIDLQVKLRGPYRVTYDGAKHRYLTTKGPDGTKEWTLGHCEAAARRVAAKLFLSHLWQVWREAEGLSTTGPWIEQYGGSSHDIIDPWTHIKPL